MSMSGGWFFVVASEAITVGDTTVQLPGLGSWLALATRKQNFAAVAWAVLAMAIVIGLYDQLLFDLGLSEITVKVHRGQVMRKMGAATLAELIRLSDQLSGRTVSRKSGGKAAR